MTVTVTGGITFSGGGITFAPSGAAANDPYFMYNSLLLPGDGTNLAQNNTFLDSSTNNFAITRNGNTTQGTFSPYGANWSNYFDGTGDYLRIADNSAFRFGTGNFTIECWINTSTTTKEFGKRIVEHYTYASNDYGWLLGTLRTAGYTLGFYGITTGTAGITLTTTTTVTPNVWHHVAVVRSGSVASLYLDGTRVATQTGVIWNDTDTIPNGLEIGQQDVLASTTYDGYISNMRIIKGTAVYDPTLTTLTVPTAPLTAVSGTSLLTSQSNRFIDNSANAFAITRSGDVAVQRFSPFSPTAAYSAGTIGGSGYFDGTGDYLTAPNNAAYQFGTGDFTIEYWIYQTASGSYRTVLDTRSSGTASPWACLINSSNQPYILITSDLTSSIAININAWNHVAIVRSGTNLSIYVNGVSGLSTTNSTNISPTGSLRVGFTVDTVYPMIGYISDIRIVKGTAVYTSAFTPPTAPVTAITNTSLLLNYTNAGIIDNTMINNLETVGDAKISTAQSKFGGGSMYFDGTTDALFEPSNLNYGYSTGDFTIEFWLYLNTTALQTIFSNLTASSGASVAPHIYYANASGIRYYVNSADRITGSALSTGVWYHIAVCRSGSSTKMFINGTQTGSTYTDTNNYGTSNPLGVGDYAVPLTGANTLNGYIDDLRVTKGYARYTTTFTPPTQALPTY